MFIFGLMTIHNIHQAKSRIHAINVIELNTIGGFKIAGQKIQASKKKLNRRLFLMLCIHIILLSVFTLPQAIQKLCSTLTSNQIQTPLKKAINNFIFNFVLLLTYFSNGMSFYIYTLSGGTIFRSALKDLTQKIRQKILMIN
jgi:hypothetical protein